MEANYKEKNRPILQLIGQAPDKVTMIKETPVGLRVSEIPRVDLPNLDMTKFHTPLPGEVEAIRKAPSRAYPKHLAELVQASPKRILDEHLRANPDVAARYAEQQKSDEESKELEAMRRELKMLQEQVARLAPVEIPCPRCGQKFDSERGLHIHQGRKHKR
jgi:Golgi nucleoside diphosphatase